MGHLQAGFLSAGAMKGPEWFFLISGGCTVNYMLKLYVALFLKEIMTAGNRSGSMACAGIYE